MLIKFSTLPITNKEKIDHNYGRRKILGDESLGCIELKIYLGQPLITHSRLNHKNKDKG